MSRDFVFYTIFELTNGKSVTDLDGRSCYWSSLPVIGSVF